MKVGTVDGAQLHSDLIDLVVFIEVRHVAAAEEGTQFIEHRGGRHAKLLAARGIDIHAVLRVVDGVA